MLMMTSVEAVVMLMMTSVEAVVMLMMTSVEAVVMGAVKVFQEELVVVMVEVEVEGSVVVMGAGTVCDTTHLADRPQTMYRLYVRTPQAMLWRC